MLAPFFEEHHNVEETIMGPFYAALERGAGGDAGDDGACASEGEAVRREF